MFQYLGWALQHYLMCFWALCRKFIELEAHIRWSHIDLRELPGYQYDATSALTWFRPKRVLESDNANEHRPAQK